MTASVRVELPASLCRLAGLRGEVVVRIDGAVTQRSVLDALEADYPALRGTLRDTASQRRRPFIRFFACRQDLSHMAADAPLPDAVADGRDVLLIIGAIAGG